ncbi:type IV secretion system DNA-binding domain-containing protein [Frankia sp. ACN1ag]|uniref:type IV secretion system DNA-binding domain-containing protein n=1 Tax=Frankia sp. ACN1ag TaxID=102891 RepID=UPI0009F9AF79|nr:type IV secretion system DNA-binding domain-containing protein [Frankia sp. ACN1ag]
MTSDLSPPPPPPPPSPGAPVGWLASPSALGHAVARLLAVWGLPAGLPLVVLVVAAALTWRRLRAARDTALVADARTVEILMPPEVHPDAAGVFWSQMSGLLRPFWARLRHGQPSLAFEIVAHRTGTAFRLWVPGAVPPGLVERAVQAAWPGARTTTLRPAVDPLPPADPTTHFGKSGLLAEGGVLRLGRADVLPLRAEPPGDPVRSLLGAAGELDDDETAAVQILARPVTGRRLAQARRTAARHRGQKASPRPWAALLDLVTPHSSRPSGTTRHTGPTPPEEAAESRAIAQKAVGPRFDVRVAYSAARSAPADPQQTPQVHAALRGRAHALATAYALYAGHNHLRRLRLPDPPRLLAARRLRRGDLVSVGELAALAHLPVDTAVPGLARAGAAAVAPPAGIPDAGPGVKTLGRTEAGRRRDIGVDVAAARHHLHILGATGSGKSTLLANMILDDAAAGRGVVVIDPKGDLVTDLLDRLPPDAADRLVLLDPDDPAPPPVLNILDGPDAGLATDQLVGIFRRIWADSWGPRTDDLLRSTCLTLLSGRRPGQPAPTLVDIVDVLTDPRARRAAAAKVSDPILGGFWDWYSELSDGARAAAVGPLMNKLRALLLRDFARAALAGGESTIDVPAVLDRGGILLVRVPKGAIGEDGAQIIGSIVLAKVWQAALRRAAVPPARRADCAAYLDECQNFLTLPGAIEDMLAEARGYRLSMVLAHQHLRQLPADLADALSTNARSKVFFAVSPRDASELARHVTPVLTHHDLARLPAFTAASRLIVDGADSAAFTLRTRPLPGAVPGRAAGLRAAARRHTAAPTAGVHEPRPRPAADPRPGQPHGGGA